MIDVAYVRELRQIAGNIDDHRIELYIDEAEKLDILPAIGAKLYQKYTNIGVIVSDGDGAIVGDEDGARISVGSIGELPVEEQKLLDGGYYTACNGEYRHFEGLKKALGYLSYSRFVRNHPVQVTPFGVVVKSGDESSPADVRMVAAIANDAQKIGKEHLAEAIRYWDDVQQSRSDMKGKLHSRFVKIGK